MPIALGLDIETTGLDPVDDRIIELCLIKVDTDTGAELGEKTWLFNPGRPIDPAAQAVHGITFERVAMEPMLDKTLAEEIALWLSECAFWIGHNGAGFDVPFIRNELFRHGVAMPERPIVDTMLDSRWATHNGKYPNLGELCFAMGVPYDPSQAHGATYDVRVMNQCALRAMKQGFLKVPQ